MLPIEIPFATILTMVEVDPEDPSFNEPTKPIGPLYGEDEAKRLAKERGWTIKLEGDKWEKNRSFSCTSKDL